MGVLPLSRFPPALPWDVEVLGRLFSDGRVAWQPPALLPAAGACALVLWRPDARPQFSLARGALTRSARGAWRFEGEGAREGWVVLVAA